MKSLQITDKEVQMTSCSICNRPIVDINRCFHRVAGWERKAQVASRKSGSDIVLREPTGELACEDCIRKIKLGIGAGTSELF